jgi:outer membrane protein assembly factor BamB
MQHNEPSFTQEHIDEWIEQVSHLPPSAQAGSDARLIQHLQAIQQTVPSLTHSLERVWERLERQSNHIGVPTQAEGRMDRHQSQHVKGVSPLNYSRFVVRVTQTWSAKVATLVAGFLLVALIGGLTVGLILVHQRPTSPLGTGPNANAPCPTTPAPSGLAPLNVYVGATNWVDKLSAQDGTLRWHVPIPGIGTGQLLVADGLVYVSVQKSPGASSQESSGEIDAFNTEDGSLAWRFPLKQGIFGVPLAVTCGLVYVYTTDPTTNNTTVLYALNASTGTVRWHVATSAPAPQNITVAGGAVFIASENFQTHRASLAAFKAIDGSRVWQVPLTDGNVAFVLQAAGGVVYLIGSIDGPVSHVYAYRATNGKLLWRSQALEGEGAAVIIARPTIASGSIYLGTETGHVYAYRAKDGKLLWRYDAGGSVNPSPQVAEGVVYISASSGGGPSTENAIVALDASHGTEHWKQGVPWYAGLSQFVFSGGALYLRQEDGSFLALSAANGAQLWSDPPRADELPPLPASSPAVAP